jgi:outer membrane protein assembly factor BamB
MIGRMKLPTATWIRRTSAINVCAIGVALFAANKIAEISINQPKDLFPESITSLKDGTIILGSVPGGVYKIKPGETEPKPLVAREGNGFTTVLGVFADENANTLWVCNTGPGVLKAFDLGTGQAKGSYPMPTGAVCNDIAVADNGTAYASDTSGGKLFMLKKGAAALEEAAADPLLAGVDGVAFGDKNTLYVNSVSANKLIRLDLGPDGKSTKVTELKLSGPLGAPDGLRAIGKNKFLEAENGNATRAGGRLTLVTVDPKTNMATIRTLKDGMQATPATTATKGMAWVVEGKQDYRNGKNKGQDPTPFKLYAVKLP